MNLLPILKISIVIAAAVPLLSLSTSNYDSSITREEGEGGREGEGQRGREGGGAQQGHQGYGHSSSKYNEGHAYEKGYEKSSQQSQSPSSVYIVPEDDGAGQPQNQGNYPQQGQ
jgi:hypothetical protein